MRDVQRGRETIGSDVVGRRRQGTGEQPGTVQIGFGPRDLTQTLLFLPSRRMVIGGARDARHAFAPRLCAMAAPHTWRQALAETIRARRVGDRPDRVEPYTVKRRPKDDPPPHATRRGCKTRACRRR